MKKSYFTLLILTTLVFLSFRVEAQYPNHPLPQYPEQWNSQWVTHPEIIPNAHNLIHFRNAFELEEKPEQFIIHISGDNRYRLFVNGEMVVYGPQLADIRHWRYETVDLAPYLIKGKNIVSAEVMNWGIDRSYGIISLKTGFLVQGHTEKERIINTDFDSNWKVYHNTAFHEKPVIWWTGKEVVGGFYAANPNDSVVAKDYPWGWKTLDYDDGDWLNARGILFTQPNTSNKNGHGWLLQPRTTVIQSHKKEIFDNIARSDLRGLKKDFIFGEEDLEIPANTSAKILIDKEYVTVGYPKIIMSGGKDAMIKIRYSEAMYDENNQKGNRNNLEGKEIKGISDVYVMDGGNNRSFQPIWFRTFRFVQLEITTSDEPLVINDFYNLYSAADMPEKGSFAVNDPLYDQVWDICRHTLEVCAQDNLLSDAYYEQMQYVGDLRPHLKGWTALTGDFTYFRSALEQFNNSRLPDGNVTSCYPVKATFLHPTYSLIWIDMVYDLMMLEGDKELIGSYMGEIEEVFAFFDSLINENGLVGDSDYHMFIDWYLPKGGNSKVNKDGNSAILTLNYAYTLKNAAKIFDWLGYSAKAKEFSDRSRMYAEIVRKQCFDETKGIYADDPGKTFYDQRAGILAILCDAHSHQEKVDLMNKILDPSVEYDSYANLFYHFYLFEAMRTAGTGNFTEALQPWKDIVELGMTGTPEKRVEQNPRSEIHPWTAHPIHYYFEVVAGIRPSTPGFQTVEITPNPADLENINASYPTILGMIEMDLQISDDKVVSGNIQLPEGMHGVFHWDGKETQLREGVNEI